MRGSVIWRLSAAWPQRNGVARLRIDAMVAAFRGNGDIRNNFREAAFNGVQLHHLGQGHGGAPLQHRVDIAAQLPLVDVHLLRQSAQISSGQIGLPFSQGAIVKARGGRRLPQLPLERHVHSGSPFQFDKRFVFRKVGRQLQGRLANIRNQIAQALHAARLLLVQHLAQLLRQTPVRRHHLGAGL